VAAGVRWAADNGADVINLSLSAEGLPLFALTPLLDDAVSYAWAMGAVVVASAGNSNAPYCESPSFSPFAICVGATTQSDTKWANSGSGARLDVVAPGVGITSTYWWKDSPSQTNVYATGTGTSASAPFVSGIAALLVSMGASNVEATAAIICSASDLGTPGYDPTYGHGLVQARAAVDTYTRAGCGL
jgi:subtilisin family serine protease